MLVGVWSCNIWRLLSAIDVDDVVVVVVVIVVVVDFDVVVATGIMNPPPDVGGGPVGHNV
jgi:hypothetical protein